MGGPAHQKAGAKCAIIPTSGDCQKFGGRQGAIETRLLSRLDLAPGGVDELRLQRRSVRSHEPGVWEPKNQGLIRLGNGKGRLAMRRGASGDQAGAEAERQYRSTKRAPLHTTFGARPEETVRKPINPT